MNILVWIYRLVEIGGNMKHFGAFETKTHFSEILKDVMSGEECVITKHGVKVAMIIPYKQEKSINPIKKSILALKMLRKGITLGSKLSIKSMKEEGRK